MVAGIMAADAHRVAERVETAITKINQRLEDAKAKANEIRAAMEDRANRRNALLSSYAPDSVRLHGWESANNAQFLSRLHTDLFNAYRAASPTLGLPPPTPPAKRPQAPPRLAPISVERNHNSKGDASPRRSSPPSPRPRSPDRPPPIIVGGSPILLLPDGIKKPPSSARELRLATLGVLPSDAGSRPRSPPASARVSTSDATKVFGRLAAKKTYRETQQPKKRPTGRPYARAGGHAPAPSAEYDELSLGGGRGASDPLLAFGYTTLGPIAAGAFSTIVRARQLGGETGAGRVVAIKSLAITVKARPKQAAPDLKYVRAEASCLRRAASIHGGVSHRHIANLLDEHETKSELHLVLDFGSGGSLHRHLQTLGHGKGMAEEAACLVLEQVASALSHLHRHGVTHRDIKPSNIVFDGNDRQSIKLVDFGFAAIHAEPPIDDDDEDGGSASARRLHTVLGTPSFMAPELVRGGGEGVVKGGYAGPPVDVWAFGALAFETLCNKPAFTAESMQALYVRIIKASHNNFADNVSKAARSFIKGILIVDPAKRPTAETAMLRVEQVLRRSAGAPAPAPAPVPAEGG